MLGRRVGSRRHGCNDSIRARHPRHHHSRRAPARATAASGRAPPRSGPSRSPRCPRSPPPTSAPATARRPSSRRSGRVRAGFRQLFSLPEGYEVVLGNGGTTCFWDAATFGLIEAQSQHLSFGEFSSKFAACAAAAPHLKDPQIIESEVGTHPLPGGGHRGRSLRPDPQRDLDRGGHAHPPARRGGPSRGRRRAGGRGRHLGGRRACGSTPASSTPTTWPPRSASPATVACGSPSCRRPRSNGSSGSRPRAGGSPPSSTSRRRSTTPCWTRPTTRRPWPPSSCWPSSSTG